jgi:twitching motility protein PilT
MTDRQPIPLLGRLAVHHQLITMDQLAEVTRAQARGDSRRIGDILVEDGHITNDQLAKLVRAQKALIAKHNARKSAKPSEDRKGKPAQPARSEAKPSEARTNKPAPQALQSSAPSEPKPSEAQMDEPCAPVELVHEVSDGAERAELDRVLRDAVERGASDIHLHSGDAVRLRIGGCIAESGTPLPAGSSLEQLALAGLTAAERSAFAERGEIDFRYTIDGVSRFRANAYRQQRGIDAVFRAIPLEAPTIEDLGLPRSLARFTSYHQGMVLVTGPTGCGKTSTLAALVDLINEERQEHILTIEDPIEYVHPSKRCLVNQRSVRRHTESFARALRAALREDPDVIVIGELRDLETISLALTAAETGHLVLATLHTENAIRTVNRLVGAFPADQQSQVRTMLADSLRAVVSQRLLPRADGAGRVAALETLVITKAVANLIRENKTFQIHSILQTGASQGMGLLDQSIRQHVQSGVVAADAARVFCQDAKSLGV